MPDYLVQWEINITADSPEAAARVILALNSAGLNVAQRDKGAV